MSVLSDLFIYLFITVFKAVTILKNWLFTLHFSWKVAYFVCLLDVFIAFPSYNQWIFSDQTKKYFDQSTQNREEHDQSDSRSRNKNQPQHTVIWHLKHKTNSVLRILCISVTVVTVMLFQNESSNCFQLLHLGLHCRVVSEYMVGTFVQSKTRRFTP